MKRFRGTKGEWKVVIPDHIGCTNVQFGDDIFNGFVEVWHHQSSKEEATANAHLICAAPEMLEFLIKFSEVRYGWEYSKLSLEVGSIINKAMGL